MAIRCSVKETCKRSTFIFISKRSVIYFLEKGLWNRHSSNSHRDIDGAALSKKNSTVTPYFYFILYSPYNIPTLCEVSTKLQLYFYRAIPL